MYRKREGISFSKLTKHSLKYSNVHPDEAKKLKKQQKENFIKEDEKTIETTG